MKTPVEKARELIFNYDFSNVNFNELFNPSYEWKTYYHSLQNVVKRLHSVNNQILHHSFKYFIDIDEANNTPTTLGYSKEGGYPHLPKNWEMPNDWEDFHFLAQLNISDFKHLDLENVFPEKGIIYLFQHFEEGDCQVYFSEEENELVERDDIEIIAEDVVPMEFSAGWIFLMNGENECGKALQKLIPKDLQNEIENLLNCKMQERIASWGMFVQPNYWQGEDEDWSEDENDDIAKEILLYQTELEDSSLHFWIDRSDLKSGNLQETYQTFSGS